MERTIVWAMPVEALAVAGAVAAIVAVVVLLQVLDHRRLAARRDEFVRESSQRGWRHSVADVPGTRVDRFQGTSLSGSWTAEVVERRGRKRPGVRLLRWWNGAADTSAPAGPVVLLLPLSGKTGLPLDKDTLGTGVFARMAHRAVQAALAFGMSHHFGALADVRGRELHRLDAEAPLVDGFAVLADQPDDARRRLTPGLLGVLRQAFRPDAWAGRSIDQPWVTLTGDRIAVACVSQKRPYAADVAALVEAGSSVARWRD
jgi:hypothetical protein